MRQIISKPDAGATSMTKMARGQGSAVEGSLPRPCLGTGIHSPAHRRRRVFPPRMTYPITAIAHALFQDRQQALALEGISASTKHRCEHQRPASCRRL